MEPTYGESFSYVGILVGWKLGVSLSKPVPRCAPGGKKDEHTFKEFILKPISADDYKQVFQLDTCHDIFEKLRKRHDLLWHLRTGCFIQEGI